MTYLGLVPFVCSAMGVLYHVSSGVSGLPIAAQFAFVQMTYGAVVLAFLGGVHFGLALLPPSRVPSTETERSLTRREGVFRFVVAALPATVAWAALSLDPYFGMVLLLGGFTVAFLADAMAASFGWLPLWYMRLRAIGTIGAVLSLGVTFVEAL